MKRSILVAALSALLIGVLSGCGGEEAKKVEEPKTAQYYKENISEAIKTYIDCVKNDHYRSDGYKSIKNQNCNNSAQGLSLAGIFNSFKGTFNVDGKEVELDEFMKKYK